MELMLTRDQVREVDRIAIEEFGISGLVLMENAGRNAARVILDEFSVCEDASDLAVVAFCGTGNNGGDGFVIARHLANAGAAVRIALCGEEARLTPDAAANLRICKAMRIPLATPDSTAIGPGDVVIDALLGTGFTGTVREGTARIIEHINTVPKRGTVAIDVPSGLDCDTGLPSNATVIADTTVTFVACKVGFRSEGAGRYVGRLHVAGIGVPPQIVNRVRG